MKNILDFLPISTDRLVLKQTDIFDIDLIMKMDKQEETQLYLGGVKNKTEAERVEFLKKKNKNEYVTFQSGWMVYPNGRIVLTTPYGGK